MEPYSRMDGHPRRSSTLSCNVNTDHTRTTFLPLMDRDRKLLPIHFLTESEVTRYKLSRNIFQHQGFFLVGKGRSHTSSVVRCMRNRKRNTCCSTTTTQKAFTSSSDVGGVVESLSSIIVSTLITFYAFVT